MAEPRFETLKTKYQPALEKIKGLHVQLQNLHLQDDKLFLKATAKTKGDSNLVWDEIKRVDANYTNDLLAQISYQSEGPPPAQQAPARPAEVASPETTPVAKTYTVQKGDTLSKIAKAFYGEAREYTRIFEANRDQLADPDLIRPGQVLRIPE